MTPGKLYRSSALYELVLFTENEGIYLLTSREILLYLGIVKQTKYEIVLEFITARAGKIYDCLPESRLKAYFGKFEELE